MPAMTQTDHPAGVFESGPERHGLAANLLAAQEEERSRVSRELHDDLGQRLALLEIQIEEMERRLGGDVRIHSGLELLRAQVGRIADDVHRICYRLHPAVLETLGLIPAVRSFCEEYSSWSGVQARFSHHGVPARLPSGVALCLYRVVQESLRNIARHSGAKRALVILRTSPRGLEAIIKDNGRGFLPEAARQKGGLGLISLCERVRLSGGICSIRSAPGRGTRIQAVIPLSMQASAD